MVVVSSTTWQEIEHFFRTAVYMRTQARRQRKNCKYDTVTIRKKKFSPETLAFMKVTPLKKLPKNEQTKNKIYEINEKLREYITQENTKKINFFLFVKC